MKKYTTKISIVSTSILILFILLTYAIPSLITPTSFLIVALFTILPSLIKMSSIELIEMAAVILLNFILFFKIIPTPYSFLTRHIYQSGAILLTIFYIVILNILVIFITRSLNKKIDKTTENE